MDNYYLDYCLQQVAQRDALLRKVMDPVARDLCNRMDMDDSAALARDIDRVGLVAVMRGEVKKSIGGGKHLANSTRR